MPSKRVPALAQDVVKKVPQPAPRLDKKKNDIAFWKKQIQNMNNLAHFLEKGEIGEE